MKDSCGLDFGTSNSSIGYSADGKPILTQFDGKGHIPSAIFFDLDLPKPLFGNPAIERYVDGGEGRMIWSPKNALGTGLMTEKTQVRNKSVSFMEIIGLIIKNLKDTCEAQSQSVMSSVVAGRPVFFNDDNPSLDRLAQESVLEVLKNAGFRNVEFEYEPIAAAIHYERSITRQQIALIVDMGGGTSDFTVARLDPPTEHSTKERNKNILSVGGIHVAGTDFDRQLSVKTLMPELGLGAKYKSMEGKWLTVPPSIYHDLATWHKIGFQYTRQNIEYVKSKVHTSDSPEKFERLLHTLKFRYGHYLARLVERSKIELSDAEKTILSTTEIKPDIIREIARGEFESSIEGLVGRISDTVKSTISDAGIAPSQIDAIFMTGGSSVIPEVRRSIVSIMPNAQIVEGDKFGSVAIGLTLSADEKFK